MCHRARLRIVEVVLRSRATAVDESEGSGSVYCAESVSSVAAQREAQRLKDAARKAVVAVDNE